MLLPPPDITFSRFYTRRNRNRIAILGDSQTAQHHNVVTTTYATQAQGYVVMLDAILGGRFIWSQADNHGVGGDKFTQIEARVPAIIATDVGTCFVHCGTNDALQIALGNHTLAPSLAAAERVIEKLLRAGIQVIVVPPQHRTQTALTNAGCDAAGILAFRYMTGRIRNALLSLCSARRGAYFADPTAAFTDKSGFTYDGTHYSTAGAFAIAAAIAPVVERVVPPLPVPMVDPYDMWDITNPTGNLLTGSMMVANPVAVATAPMTGSVPSGWAAQISGQGTVTSGSAVFSIVDRPDGQGKGVRLLVTNLIATGATALIGLSATLTTDGARLASGDLLRCAFAADQAAGSVGFKGIQGRHVESDGSGTGNLDVPAPGLAFAGWPTDARRVVLNSATFPVRASAGAGSRQVICRMFVSLDTTAPGGASCDVTFWAPSLRKVVS